MKKIKEEQVVLNKSIVSFAEKLDAENVLDLIKEGADVNAMDEDNETLLTIVAKTFISDYVPDTFDGLLSLVKDENNREKIITLKKAFEKEGYDFSDGKIPVPTMDSYIINLAGPSTAKRIELMDILLKLGADINLLGKDGVNAMYYAVSNANPDIVDFLLKNGADSTINYYPEEPIAIFETMLDKAYIDLQIAEGHLKDMDLYRYDFIDGLDKELIREKIHNYKRCIELLENAVAQ